MAVTLEQLKKLRLDTGVSMMACKKALEETNGDYETAVQLLRKKGVAKAASRAERITGNGVIASYIHSNNTLGVLVHLGCETDFVAKNEEFQSLGRNIAMHIAASSPLYVSPEEVPTELVEKEKEIWAEQLKTEGKPENMIEKIMEGKEKKFREEVSLLTQPYVKNPEITIGQLLSDYITKIGENIKVVKFIRFSV
ncbi:translation elongation factor Ts [Patescibacteria group bacterium]|nr:translation elongation factor Ts [Patescibacteria group bacterium]